MTYTLWRGDLQLGRFTEHHPVLGDNERIVGTFGVLDLTVASEDLSSVWQTRDPFRPMLVESPLEPIRYGPDGNRVGRPRSFARLEPLSEEQTRGLPDDRVLRVKDENSHQVETESVILQQVIIADGIPLNGLHRARGLSEQAREVWSVTVINLTAAT